MEELQSTDYYARAAGCLEAAQKAPTPAVRQAYLDLMKLWIGLAERSGISLTRGLTGASRTSDAELTVLDALPIAAFRD